MIDFHATVDQDQVDILVGNILNTDEFLQLRYGNDGIGGSSHRHIRGVQAIDRGILGDGRQPFNLKGFRGRPKLVRQRR